MAPPIDALARGRRASLRNRRATSRFRRIRAAPYSPAHKESLTLQNALPPHAQLATGGSWVWLGLGGPPWIRRDPAHAPGDRVPGYHPPVTKAQTGPMLRSQIVPLFLARLGFA